MNESCFGDNIRQGERDNEMIELFMEIPRTMHFKGTILVNPLFKMAACNLKLSNRRMEKERKNVIYSRKYIIQWNYTTYQALRADELFVEFEIQNVGCKMA